jgi:hypothetical protein
VLRIFIALENLGRVLNAQPLGPVASTLTTTPSRRRKRTTTSALILVVHQQSTPVYVNRNEFQFHDPQLEKYFAK